MRLIGLIMLEWLGELPPEKQQAIVHHLEGGEFPTAQQMYQEAMDEEFEIVITEKKCVVSKQQIKNAIEAFKVREWTKS